VCSTVEGAVHPLSPEPDGLWSQPVTESQKVIQQWETPSLEDIAVISRADVQALESTSDEAMWARGGMHHVVLRTVGRKSGREHKVAIPIWRDPDDVRVVVASYAGAPHHPSWYINLADRSANPEVRVRTQEGEYWSVPEILDGDEYARIWALLAADRAWYDDYKVKTTRQIPLVRLPETREAR
jgi:deazaflavin-dependent oxidoreductase (nitroreductase family)